MALRKSSDVTVAAVVGAIASIMFGKWIDMFSIWISMVLVFVYTLFILWILYLFFKK